MLTVKFGVPSIAADYVSRSRLLVQMDEAHRKKLTLVCAPAGYGKTSLAASWVRAQGEPIAWVSLDARDNDLMRFWAYIASSLAHTYPGLDRQLPLLFVNKEPASFEPGLSILFNELHRHPTAITVVLDDYHLITIPDIHETLAYFVQQMPAQVHLVLLSRTEPPLQLPRLLASGQLNRLGHADLRFATDEATAFFRTKLPVEAADELMASWLSKTEGWIAGMQLAALSVQQAGPVGQLSGDEWPITDYLWEEVFNQQPEDVQTFLLKTSFLSRLCVPLCESVTGLRDSRSTMEYIEKHQLFLISLDRRKEWYRYHHLFSDFLLDRLRKRERETMPRLHAAAASWFEEHGYDEDAIEHYFAAQQFDRAAAVILRLLPAKLKQEWLTLANWLEMLPEEQLQQHPRLYLTHTYLLCLHGKMEEAERRLADWEQLWAERAGQWPADEAGRLHADAIVIRIYIATERADAAAAVAHVVQYLHEVSEDGLFLFVYHKFNSTSTMRHDPKVEGKPTQAEAFFGHLLKYAAHSQTIGKAICTHGYAEALYSWNRLEEAERYADESLSVAVKRGYEVGIVAAATVLTHIYVAKGDVAAGQRMIATAQQHPAIAANPYWWNQLKLQQLRIDLGGEQRKEIAAAWLEHNPPSVMREDAGLLPGWGVLESIMRARVLIAAEQYKQAVDWLERLAAQLEQNGFLLDNVELLLLRCRVYLQMHDLPAAMGSFSEALQLAAPEKLIRVFVDEGEPVAVLLAEYMHLRQTNHIRVADGVPMQYVKRLVTEMRLAPSPPHRRTEKASSLAVPITRAEAKVLALICEGLSNARIADELNIAVGTVKTHIHRLYAKLGVSSRFEAIQKSKALQLFPE